MNIINDLQVLSGKKEKTTPQQNSGQKRSLLIVEDEKALASILEDRFSREGYQVFQAQNGQEGLEMAKAHHPQVILLDLMMPVMDGKSMLIKLREIEDLKKTPVVVLTNAGEADNIRITQHYFSAVDFLIKSNVTLDQIVKRVKDFTY